MKKLTHNKILTRILSFVGCVPFLFFCLSFNVHADGAGTADPITGETTETTETVDVPVSDYANLLSLVKAISAGANIALNIAEDPTMEYHDLAEYLQVWDFSGTPIYVKDGENYKPAHSLSDLEDIGLSDAYVDSNATMEDIAPLINMFSDIFSGSDNPSLTDSYSWPWSFSFSNLGSYDFRVTKGGTSNSWSFIFNSDYDGYTIDLYSDYVYFRDLFSLNNGFFNIDGGDHDFFIHRLVDGSVNEWYRSSEDFSFSSYNPIIELNPNSPVLVFDNTVTPMHVALYVNGSLVESWDDYISGTGHLYSQYNSIADAQSGSASSGLADVFSNAISGVKAGVLAAADPDALRIAAQNYSNTANKDDTALQAYLDAINAALAASTATQQQVSSDLKGISGALGKVLTWLQNIYNSVILITSKVLSWNFADWFQQVLDGLIALPQGIIAAIEAFAQAVALDIAGFKEFFELDFSDMIRELVASLSTTIDTGLAAVVAAIEAIQIVVPDLDLSEVIDKLSEWTFTVWFTELLDTIESWDFTALFGDLKNALVSILENIKLGVASVVGFVESIVTSVSDIFTLIRDWSLVSYLTDIFNGVISIPDAITASISGVLTDLFVMDEAMQAEVDAQIEETFEPISWIKQFATDFRTFIHGFLGSNAEPPKIPIHLGNATSKYNWGGDEYIIDLSFWAPYKPFADAIVIFFAWAFYLWHLFKTLPSLILGGDGLVPGPDPITVPGFMGSFESSGTSSSSGSRRSIGFLSHF